jgi:hypothetical protein
VTQSQRPFERFRLRAGVIALATVAVSLGLIALGVSLQEGFAKTLLITVATAILAIGGISFLYETYLRRTLTQDVLQLVQLEESLADSGVRAISKRSTVDWRQFFSGAERIRLLPIDPVSWRADEWVHVADIALHRDPTIEIYLPNPTGVSLADVANRLGRGEDSFESEISRILRELEAECKALHARFRGRMTIYTYDGTPSYGISVADDRFVVAVPDLFKVPGAAQIIAMQFGRGEDNLMKSWVSNQLDGLPDTGTYFTT